VTAHYLLLGAGFSRNWGGWLANEAFEYLLSHNLSSDVRRILIDNRSAGFEGALSVLQNNRQLSLAGKEPLEEFQRAVAAMFDHMNLAFLENRWFARRDELFSVIEFLPKFDAIFTLNQDLLLESNYLTLPTGVYLGGRWQANHLPGIVLPSLRGPDDNIFLGELTPSADLQLNLRSDFQPIFKLHGSRNWRTSDTDMMVLGANKAGAIARFPILSAYFREFQRCIHDDGARLMIIGYGFRDDHINSVIDSATRKTLIKTFVIDPLGLDVLDPYYGKGNIVRGPAPLLEAILPRCVGASRRNFRDVLARDEVELKKIMRFFDS
jgi:hypothetical protein